MKNIINMIRLRIHNFITRHKDKIKDLGQKLIMVAMGVFIATIILSILSNNESTKTDNNDISNVYKPTQTIIKGPNVSKEQFEQDSNLVNTFIDYCNNREVEKAYNLISDECKEEKYPTLEEFKEFYYNDIFARKRECNLQAWISTKDYTVYEIRYANNMLATGTYDENDVYQDYITLNRKNNTEKISIGHFIDSKKSNIITNVNGLEVIIVKKSIYMTYEEYEINIKNNMETTILLNTLENSETIQLIATSGEKYNFNMNKLFYADLIIEPNRVKTIKIAFKKGVSSNNNSEIIEFSNIIKDYESYQENKETYADIIEMNVKVEE